MVPAWLDNWDEFVQELETNFSPYNDIGDVEDELSPLKCSPVSASLNTLFTLIL
jgi:hypothetical protein